jgi:HD-GYP domain-containing protein (c-di-GMP phosphodiesterase class II)
MQNTSGRLLSQPGVGISTGALAVIVLFAGWMGSTFGGTPILNIGNTLLALGLIVALIVAYQFPIQIHYHQKMYMGSVPYFLMAVLLPAPLAATAAGLGTLLAELAVRQRRGNYPSDIATAAGRWTIIVMTGALVAAQAPDGSAGHALALVAAGAILFAGDILTMPLMVSPMSGEGFLRVSGIYAREAGIPEAAQYILGLLGALEAREQIWALALLVVPLLMIYWTAKRAKEMRDSTRRLLEGMADTVDLRDPYTGGHSRRVTELSERILHELRIDRDGANMPLIMAAARLHDIGKIGIPDHVLNKPGPLTPEERLIMETHPEKGADLLAQYPDFARGVAIVRHHHERWDGTGYPHRLRGAEIPFGARVIAVADGYDAMTSDRPYRPAMTPHKAAEILRGGRGTQWDPTIVDAFLRAMGGEIERAPQRLRVVERQTERVLGA